jgi:dihydrofolate synthase/folylpolyglutamate synthase
MNLSEWIEKIQKVHPVSWDLGLDRVGEVGRRLDVLRPAQTTFLVAGTNGKGSTCEVLAQLCNAYGQSFGKATSPFLLRYNEQFIVNNNEVEDDEIISAFKKIEVARAEISLTYFEFSALAALIIFKQSNVDVAILEIGLGGRLDAMNIVDPDVSIITQIAIDHEQWLGSDRESIAKEKAGIYRSGRPCILVDNDPPQALFEEAVKSNANIWLLNRDFVYERGQLKVSGQEFDIRDTQLPVQSVLGAILAFEQAGYPLDQTKINSAVRSSELFGRFQQVAVTGSQGQDLVLILDVAHNPNAAQLLLENLQKHEIDHVQAIVGVYQDKDIDQMFKILSPIVKGWHFPKLDVERASSVEKLSHHLSHCCGLEGNTYAKVADAYDAATKGCESGGVVLVFGSFSMVASMLNHLNNKTN